MQYMIILYYIIYIYIFIGPSVWSSAQSFWLQIQRSRVRLPALPEKNVVSLERGPLGLVSTTEELLDRKVAAPV
jgi:hypothetical protein